MERCEIVIDGVPHHHISLGSEKLIDWLIRHNVIPMIAHLERNRGLWLDPELLSFFKQCGCLFQITAALLMGYLDLSQKG